MPKKNDLVAMVEEHSQCLDILLQSMRRDLGRIEDLEGRGLVPPELEWVVLRLRSATVAISEVMKNAEDLVLSVHTASAPGARTRDDDLDRRSV